MREAKLTLPEISLIAGTRVALGAGAGLLLSEKLDPGKRRAVGWTLLLVGVATTFPLAINVLCKSESVRRKRGLGGLFG
ncbi:MAG TPA: hypothetical protein VFG19_17705 [Geobacteraceae bacterium]|nr:hypothetical protein [Geobacteraceae bacterium]